jgi:heparan-alpha-glucosaminide N-acetyltransferase
MSPNTTPSIPSTDLNQVAPRLVSIDVFRGWVMFMMLAHMLGFCEIAEEAPESGFWNFLCFHWSHVEWRGMALHDLIQPGFSFLVGTALAFSLASRRRKGQSDGMLVVHAAWRGLVLVLLGVFLRSFGRDQTYWTFEDTLSQIGLGYLPLVLIAISPRVVTWASIGILLVGYWLAFAIYPLPADNFDYALVGVDSSWPHLQDGFASHWNKNSNLAWRFDTWFLNLFPAEKPFTHNDGGYSTLSFIPTLATMLLGLVGGRWLQSHDTRTLTLRRFAIAAIVCLGIGYLLDATGICPNVKRIWTPAWVLFSGGWCFLVLGLLHAVCDRAGYRKWAFPLVVFGVNSIVAYVMEWFMPGFIRENLNRHLGHDWAESIVGPLYTPLLAGGTTLLLIWLILLWMHQRKIYIKI